MNPFRTVMGARSRRSKSQFVGKPRNYHARRELREARQLVGRDLANEAPRRRIPVWLIPGIVVGGVFAALAITHVRVELIGQGYKRYSAAERVRLRDRGGRVPSPGPVPIDLLNPVVWPSGQGLH